MLLMDLTTPGSLIRTEDVREAHPSLKTAEWPKRLTSWWRSGRGSTVHSSHAATEERHDRVSELTRSHMIKHTRGQPTRTVTGTFPGS